MWLYSEFAIWRTPYSSIYQIQPLCQIPPVRLHEIPSSDGVHILSLQYSSLLFKKVSKINSSLQESAANIGMGR